MWKYPPFLELLECLVELPCIGEVIIINNDVLSTPSHSALSHHKVRMRNFIENRYVNPAWNLGANLAENDILCFLNDDVTVDLKLFIKVNTFFKHYDSNGIVGIRYKFSDEEYITTGDIQIVNEPLQAGWATCFFISKKNWIPIPEELKIYWGDMWQLYCQVFKNGNKMWSIRNCFAYTPMHTTVFNDDSGKEKRKDIIIRDIIEWRKLVSEHFPMLMIPDDNFKF